MRIVGLKKCTLRKTLRPDSQGDQRKNYKASPTARAGKAIRTDYKRKHQIARDVLSISATCFAYQAQLSAGNAAIAYWHLRLTTAHKHWGFGLCFMFLFKSKGFH
jgi:hypothetical protein